MRRSLGIFPLIIFAFYAVYYYFSHQELTPITKRTQLIDLTSDEEIALGLQSYQDILKKSVVLTDGKIVQQVKKIGKKIAAIAKEAPDSFNWEFNVIKSKSVNAFALPGGKVAVYTGLVPIAKNTNGMAVVMGHEIAHAIARHGAERLAYQKLQRLGSLAVSLSIGDMDTQTQGIVMGALGIGSKYGILLPFSRKHESEADYIGLILIARACFDPREAPLLWQRMSKAGGSKSLEFMSTHPNHDTRIQQLNEWMPEALEIYNKNCKVKLKNLS
jgi:predicted Zn-dependent protease